MNGVVPVVVEAEVQPLAVSVYKSVTVVPEAFRTVAGLRSENLLEAAMFSWRRDGKGLVDLMKTFAQQ